jgi:diguanylate cyclase (GGDEF)-like protein/PAS domain S-box-containing protein
LTGYSTRECLGRDLKFLEGPETDRKLIGEFNRAITTGKSIRRELLHYRKTGETFWNDLTLDPVRDAEGAINGYIGVCVDVTAQHISLEEMTRDRQRLEDITNHIPGFVYRRVMKPDGTLEHHYLSSSFRRLLGMPDNAIMETPFLLDYVHPEDRGTFAETVRQSAATLSTSRLEIRLVSTEGVVRWMRSDATPRLLPNGDIVWDGVALDITAEKTAEHELAFLSDHDSLTGLANRAHFKTALAQAIAAISEGHGIGLFAIDIHRLKDINDAFGHAAGDQALRLIGQRLKAQAENMSGTAARLSSDEFALLLPGAANADDLQDFADAIFDTLSLPARVADENLVIQAYIGAVLFPSVDDLTRHLAADMPAELLKRADIALRAAKQAGENSYNLYAAGADDRFRNEVALRHSMRRAVDEGQFALHYQPLVNMTSGRIVGAEALVRWNHPTLGMQRPDQFIPLAEDSGLIAPIGAWVMTEAMKCRQAWVRRGLKAPTVAINVSGIQLKKPDFLDVVEQALFESGADPNGFEFELTEGLMIETSDETRAVLHKLRDMGFCITIDDFGVGYSTFKYLREFPVDKIKIDQTFIRNLSADSSDASIITAMIGLARSLELQIVAEGVETAFHRRFLKAEGCPFAQGYFFSPPLAEEDFAWLIESEVKLPRPKFSSPDGAHAPPTKRAT